MPRIFLAVLLWNLSPAFLQAATPAGCKTTVYDGDTPSTNFGAGLNWLSNATASDVTTMPHGGVNNLQIAYNWPSGYYAALGWNWTRYNASSSRVINLNNFTDMEFWIRASTGAPVTTLTVTLVNAGGTGGGAVSLSFPVTLTTYLPGGVTSTWQQVVIPTSAFATGQPGYNRAQIGEIDIATGLGMPSGTQTIFFDDFGFYGTCPPTPTVTETPTNTMTGPTATPTPTFSCNVFDDYEDGNMVNNMGGQSVTYSWGGGATNSPPALDAGAGGSLYSARVYGTNNAASGFAYESFISPGNRNLTYLQGLRFSFMASSAGLFRVKLVSPAIASGDGDQFGYTINVTSPGFWQYYSLTAADLTREGWGSIPPQGTVSLSQALTLITSIAWQTGSPNPSPVTMWVDDICFLSNSPPPTATMTWTDSPTPMDTNTPTITRTPTDTRTETSTRTETNTRTETSTPTVTNTRTDTRTLTSTSTPASTNTPTNSRTSTNTMTLTSTRTDTATRTETPTRTNTGVFTDTRTLTSTATLAMTSTFTATRTVTNTMTLSATRTQTSTLTQSPTRTDSPTRTPTGMATDTRTQTPTLTATSTRSDTPTRTSTSTITDTPTRTLTSTLTVTATRTASPTPTQTNSQTASPTPTASRTSTNSPTITLTSTPANTSTNTPFGAATSTSTQTPTNSPTRTSTLTATRTLTGTATSSSTASLTSSRTATPSATQSPTNTPFGAATSTSTQTPTRTPTGLLTATSSSTSTFTPAATSTNTPFGAPTSSSTATPTLTGTSTATVAPTLTGTSTLTSTPTLASTSTSTMSPTVTPTRTPTPVVITTSCTPFPNPATGLSPISFCVIVPGPSTVTLDVFSTAMRLITRKAVSVSGVGTVVWEATDSTGAPVATGLYYLRVTVIGPNPMVQTLKVLVVR